MFRHFLDFELRFWLRGWMVWIFLVVIAAMIFGATSSDQVTVGGAIGNTHRNAPYVVQNFYAIMGILTLLMTTAFVNAASIRDFQYNTHQLLFSLPVRKWGFLLGRYFGSATIAILPALGVTVGVALARYMPWVDAERFGPEMWMAHGWSVIVFAIPNTLFAGAILFAVAARFRSTTVSFLAALLLLVAYGVTESLTQDMKNETVAAMLDPFGARAFALTTKYWTVAERNTQWVVLNGLMLWNRLLWLAVGALVLVAGSWSLRLGEPRSRRRRRQPAVEEETLGTRAGLPAMAASWKGNVTRAHFAGMMRMEFRQLVKTPTFIVVVAAAFLNCVPSLWFSSGEFFGTKRLPVTYWVNEVIQGTLYLFVIALLTYFAGQLVWRERDDRVDEVEDSMPRKDWVSYAAKFSTLVVALFLIILAACAAGIIVQAARGYTRFQPWLYAEQLLWRDMTAFVFLAVVAFFFHVVAPNKYVGYFAFIAYLIADAFGWTAADISTRMVNFGSRPSLAYSEFFHFEPGNDGWWWFTAYWTLFCGVVAASTVLLWRRGKETAWPARLRISRQRFRGGLRAATLAMACGFLATGGWVYYNTKVLNRLVSPKEAQRRRADYEKTYKKFEKLVQPRVVALKYDIDLDPERRNMTMRVTQTAENKTDAPIREVHFTLDDSFEYEIRLPGAKLRTDDQRLRYRIYDLTTPMMPGERRHMELVVRAVTRGFANSVERPQIVENGTFFNNTIAPQIGYQPSGELEDRNDRRKYGLPEKDLMPALERNCTSHCMNTYLSNNSDWVTVESVMRTSPGQIAIAPGSLVREWNENGKRCFEYRLDHASLNFYSFISAQYAVAREQWNGVNLEVYYHPEHNWNVKRMLESIRKSLEYYTAHFGPYTHKQARIIEFPRIAQFAQAFPGTMPYSEAIGFIADLRDKDAIDFVYYVVAHEMGHQWWAHQVIGANMQGATMLSETQAQYSALMVMEKTYGRDMMRRFLEYEMDRYLRSRGRERLKERPLEKVEGSQGYIHYNKGSVVMYFLKEMLGEEAVNRALRKMVDAWAYQGPPYPTSYALTDELRLETPAEYSGLFKNLFEEITLFSNRTLEATAKRRADGKYDVTVSAEAKKFKADDQGAETEVKVDDWIEIGAFAKPEKGKKFGRTLYRDRIRVQSASVKRTFTVAELPEKAGIDPFHLLVDRTPDDNTKAVEEQK